MKTLLQISDEAYAALEALLKTCKAQGFRIATAESLTAGGIGFALSHFPGSSAMLDRGSIVYTEAAKMAMLSVQESALRSETAVSATVANQMVEGALMQSEATFSIAVTGYADSGSLGGTVYIATAYKHDGCANVHEVQPHQFTPEREATRQSTIEEAIFALTRVIEHYISKYPSVVADGQLAIQALTKG